jgi:hypothetical protein
VVGSGVPVGGLLLSAQDALQAAVIGSQSLCGLTTAVDIMDP